MEKFIYDAGQFSGFGDRGVNNISKDAFVEKGVEMGKGNTICAGAKIYAGTVIGDGNYIGPDCIIGDYPEKIGYWDKRGKVLIYNGCRFTKQVTIDGGTEKATIIGSNVIMLKNAHVGHDAQIGDNTILSCNTCVGGHTVLGDSCNFGLGAVVHQRLIVPRGIMLGMNSTITKKTQLEACMKYVGSPARRIGENKR